jgi:syntaxin 16
MASRNLTKEYHRLRARHQGGALSSWRERVAQQRNHWSHALMTDDDDDAGGDKQPASSSSSSSSSDTHVRIDVVEGSLAPQWVDIVETIQQDIVIVRDKLKQLKAKHAERLQVRFDDADEHAMERAIELLTQEITAMFKRSESALKRIATIGVGNISSSSTSSSSSSTSTSSTTTAPLSRAERTIRLNVMRAVAADLQRHSKAFRACQKSYFTRLKGQESLGSATDDIFLPSSGGRGGGGMSIEEAMDKGFTPQQMQQMHELEQSASERDQEIMKIASSINDLATIFRELSVLVIEQGSVLDRIDYNIVGSA